MAGSLGSQPESEAAVEWPLTVTQHTHTHIKSCTTLPSPLSTFSPSLLLRHTSVFPAVLLLYGLLSFPFPSTTPPPPRPSPTFHSCSILENCHCFPFSPNKFTFITTWKMRMLHQVRDTSHTLTTTSNVDLYLLIIHEKKRAVLARNAWTTDNIFSTRISLL